MKGFICFLTTGPDGLLELAMLHAWQILIQLERSEVQFYDWDLLINQMPPTELKLSA